MGRVLNCGAVRRCSISSPSFLTPDSSSARTTAGTGIPRGGMRVSAGDSAADRGVPGRRKNKTRLTIWTWLRLKTRKTKSGQPGMIRKRSLEMRMASFLAAGRKNGRKFGPSTRHHEEAGKFITMPQIFFRNHFPANGGIADNKLWSLPSYDDNEMAGVVHANAGDGGIMQRNRFRGFFDVF